MRSEASPLLPLCYVYWVALTTLGALLLITLALSVVRQALWPRKPSVTKPSRQGKPEAGLVDALHLLDAVTEKTWRRLRQLEKKREKSQN